MPITSRIAMGELEKYFSGKVITEPFEAFLTVLILIHYVEKYTWLYRLGARLSYGEIAFGKS
jgi:hypothetical protein